jgi:hypothetical protein
MTTANLPALTRTEAQSLYDGLDGIKEFSRQLCIPQSVGYRLLRRLGCKMRGRGGERTARAGNAVKGAITCVEAGRRCVMPDECDECRARRDVLYQAGRGVEAGIDRPARVHHGMAP